MLVAPSKVVDVGVDYFTATSIGVHDSKLLLLKADSLLWQERKLGFFVKPWSMRGYSGWHCGRLQFGQRDDGAIVRLSSQLAASYWFDCWQISERCSRVDLQATLLCDGPVTPEVFAIAASAQRHYANRTDGPKITLWTDNNDGATVYLGSRKSPLYFRGYNKEAESGLAEYERCLRLELEVKHRVTTSLIEVLFRAESIKAGILSILSSYLRDRGISCNFSTEHLRSFYERSPIQTDCLNSLEWLARAVAPVVQRLIESGLLDETLKSLGLHTTVQPL